MISMQYNIALPADYDMEIIKKRVYDNGSKTDGFIDLKMKVYLIAEKSRYANWKNQYAPFYLWDKEDGMNTFLLGGPFNNIINSFGRPAVNNWMVLHEQVKKLSDQQFGILQNYPIYTDCDFKELCEIEEANYFKWIADKSTTIYVTGYNPKTWEICRFHVSTDLEMLQEVAKGSLIYDVYHVS